MKLTEKEAALEAILFTMGEAVETKRLAEAIGETPEKTRELLEKLRAGWEKEHRGVNLISLDDSWQMCTRSEFYDYLIRIAKAPKKYTLTDTLLETLSIIAYTVSYTHLRAHETDSYLVCRLLLEKKKKIKTVLIPKNTKEKQVRSGSGWNQ